MPTPREPLKEPQCAVRPGEPCRLCAPGATGPDNCPLAYLVWTDEDLFADLMFRKREQERKAAKVEADLVKPKPRFWVEPDGHGELNIWHETGNPFGPDPVARQYGVTPEAWELMLSAIGKTPA